MPDYKKIYEVLKAKGLADPNVSVDVWGSEIANDPNRTKALYIVAVNDMKQSGVKNIPTFEAFSSAFEPLKKKVDTPVSSDGVGIAESDFSQGYIPYIGVDGKTYTNKPEDIDPKKVKKYIDTDYNKMLKSKGLSGGIPIETAEEQGMRGQIMALRDSGKAEDKQKAKQLEQDYNKKFKTYEQRNKEVFGGFSSGTPDWTRNVSKEIGELPQKPDPQNYMPTDLTGKAYEPLSDEDALKFWNENRNNPEMGGSKFNFPMMSDPSKGQELYKSQFKPENNPKFQQDLFAYQQKFDKLKEINPVMGMPVELVNEAKFARQNARRLGITPKEMFEAKRPVLADQYLSDEFKVENNILGQLESAREQYRKFVTNPLATQLGKEEYKAQLERLGSDITRLRDEHTKYKITMSNDIDRRVGELKKTLAQVGDNPQEVANINKEIERLQSQKELFISPQAVLKVAEDVLNVGSITSHEQVQEAYMALSNRRDKLKAGLDIAGNVLNMPEFMMRYISGNFVENEGINELVQIEQQLKALAPIALVNRNPIDEPMGALQRVVVQADKVFNPLKDRTQIKMTSQDIAENTRKFVTDLQIQGLVPEKQMDVVAKAGEAPEAFSADWFADFTGSTLGLAPAFAVGALVTKGLGSSLAATRGGAALFGVLDKLDKGEDVGKFAAALYNGVKSGIQYEATGRLFGANELIADEGNFAAGFLGGVLSSPLEKLDVDVMSAKMMGLFGNKAKEATKLTEAFGRTIKAAGVLGTRGISETLEEYGNELGSIYTSSDSWQEMKEQIEERFGTLDKNVEFVVATMIMGMGMGLGSAAGKIFTAKGSEAYNNLPKKKQQVVDNVMGAVVADVNASGDVPPVAPPAAPSDVVDVEAEDATEETPTEPNVPPSTPPVTPTEETPTEETPTETPAEGAVDPDVADAEEIARQQRIEAGLEEAPVVEQTPSTEATPAKEQAEPVSEQTPPTSEEAEPAEVSKPLSSVEETETPTEKAEAKPTTKTVEVPTSEVKSVSEIPKIPDTVKLEGAETQDSKQARAEGERQIDGVVSKRKSNLTEDEVVLGATGKSTFKPGEASNIPYVHGLTTLDRVVPTQKRSIWNPLSFLWDSQPKPISEERVAENEMRATKKFENDQIGPSGVDPFTGFLNVNTRGEVFQGTGRWNILNEQPDIQSRIDYLKSPEVVAVTGITPEQIDAFVAANPGKKIEIVRIYNVTDSQAVKLGDFGSQERESDVKGTRENQVVAKITQDGYRKISNAIASLNLTSDKPKSINEMWNDIAEKVMKILQKEKILSPTEASKIFNREEEKLTPSGVEFMRQIAYRIAYGNAATKIDSLKASVQDKLADIIPYLLAVEPSKQINNTMKRVVDAVYSWEKSGADTVDTWKKQKSGTDKISPLDQYTELELALAAKITSDMNKALFVGMFKEYLKSTQGYSDLFGSVPPSSIEESSLRAFGVAYTDPQLLTKPKVSEAQTAEQRDQATKEAASKLSKLKSKKKPDILDVLDKGKIDTDGTLNAFGIAPATWNLAIDGVKLAIKAGRTIRDAVNEGIAVIKKKYPKFDGKLFERWLIDRGIVSAKELTDLSATRKGDGVATRQRPTQEEFDKRMAELDAETVAEVRDIIIDKIRGGQSPSLSFFIKNFIDEDMEEFLPELTLAYEMLKYDDSVRLEVRNGMSSLYEIDALTSKEGLKKLKQEYEQEKQNRELERQAEERRKALISDLDVSERPIYNRGAGGFNDANAGRPSLRYALSTRANESSSNAVVEIVTEGQYKGIDEHQRYGVNAILTSFKRGVDGFMLADGPGVGKSLQLIVAALEGYKMTGKKSLIVTENRAIIEKNFKADGIRLLEMKGGFPFIDFATYSDVRTGKVKGEYGFALFDEAHNMKNRLSQQSMESANIKSDFRAYSTATPADKPTHLHYWMPDLLGISDVELGEILGYEIVYTQFKNEKTPRVEWKYTTNVADYIQKLIAVRNKLIEDGKMLRRNYPFYGQITEAVMPVPQNVIDIQNKIDDYYKRKARWKEMDMRQKKFSASEIANEVRKINETKVGYQQRALEPLKLPYIASVVQTELEAGRKVVIMFNGASDEVSITLGRDETVEFENAITQMRERLQNMKVPFATMTGAKTDNNAEAAEKFRTDKIKVAMGTFQSMSTGIDLDDQVGNSPVTLIMASYPSSAQIFEQALFRVSRRNTASPAKVITVFTNAPVDVNNKKRFEAKAQVMNAINEGTAQTENLTKSSFDPTLVAEMDTRGDMQPNIQINKDGNSFSVNNVNNEIYAVLTDMGGIWRDNAMRFPISALEAAARVLDQNLADTDNKKTASYYFEKAIEELNAITKGLMGNLGVNPIMGSGKLLTALAKAAYWFVVKNKTTTFNGFHNFLKSRYGNMPVSFFEAARKAFASALKYFKGKPTSRQVAKKAFDDLTTKEQIVYNSQLDYLQNNSTSGADLRGKLTALAISLLNSQNPISKNVGAALIAYRDYADTQGAASLRDWEIARNSVSLTTEGAIAMKALENVISTPRWTMADVKENVSRRFKLLFGNIDRPFVAISKFFENPIRGVYAMPLLKERHEMSLEHQAELLKGTRGKAQINQDRIVKEVTGGIWVNGVFSPMLSQFERLEFEKYLFARRALDRVATENAAGDEKQSRQTGNVDKAMGEAMLNAIAYNLGNKRSISDFEHRAEVFQKVMDDNLQMLVDTGKISPESYAAIKKQNDFYATFRVVLDGFENDANTKYDQGSRADASVVRSIKGISQKLSPELRKAIPEIQQLVKDLESGLIDLNKFFTESAIAIDLAYTDSKINEDERVELIQLLGMAGFKTRSILGAAENILYRSVISAERNMFMNRMAKIADMDTDDVVARVAKVEAGKKYEEYDSPGRMAIPFSKDGIRMVLITDEAVGASLMSLNYKELNLAEKALQYGNAIQRFRVITANVKFFVINMMNDVTTMLMNSKMGVFMGLTMDKPWIKVPENILKLPLDLTYAMALSTAYRLYNYKVWRRHLDNKVKQMGYDVDKGLFKAYNDYMSDPAFVNPWLTASVYDYTANDVEGVYDRATGVIAYTRKAFKALWSVFELVAGVSDETIKIAAFRRRNRLLKEAAQRPNSVYNDVQVMMNYASQLSREVRQSGTPDFANIPKFMQALALFRPFIGATTKGIGWDFRRTIAGLGAIPMYISKTLPKNNPIRRYFEKTSRYTNDLTDLERIQIAAQQAALMGVCGYIAQLLVNPMKGEDDEDETSYSDYLDLMHEGLSKDYIPIPTGNWYETTVSRKDKKGNEETASMVVPEYFTMRVRGVPKAIWNGIYQGTRATYNKKANMETVYVSFFEELSPVNIRGNTAKDRFESFLSGVTPVLKTPLELQSNRVFYNNRYAVSPHLMLNYERYQRGLLNGEIDEQTMIDHRYAPWDIYNPYNIDPTDIQLSKWLYENMDIMITAQGVHTVRVNFGYDETGDTRRLVTPWKAISDMKTSSRRGVLDPNLIFADEE